MAVNTNKLKQAGKGIPPQPVATNNLKKPAAGRTVPLQLQLDPELKREYRVYAAETDTDMSALFATVWRYFKAHHS